MGRLGRDISGAFSSAVASMTLGDILQRDAVMCQSAHIRASMEATGHRVNNLERELAGLRYRLRRSEEAAAAAHTASAAIDRVSAKSYSFRIPRSRLWDGEDLSSGTATTVWKDSLSAQESVRPEARARASCSTGLEAASRVRGVGGEGGGTEWDTARLEGERGGAEWEAARLEGERGGADG